MHENGYLALVLHAHLPFVRHPEHDPFLEEDWLYEAITETYLPLLAMLGASSAQLYTLAQAAAYARLPGRPGLVNALLGPLHWVDVVAPLALGALLSQWGMNAALAALAVQPLVCVLVARAAGAAEPEAT